MFYDLNVPWRVEGGPETDRDTQRTIAFLDELGYNVVALSHTLKEKNPNANLTCAIPDPLPFPTPPSMRILRRCNLVLSGDSAQFHRIGALNNAYDILALRPTDEKTLKQACETADCDIISIDLTQRLSSHFKFKMLAQAVERGVRFEICYAPGILAENSPARRNAIGNIIQLIRATRSRGIIVSSGTPTPIGCRSPWDVINLTTVWGLGQERGKEALTTEARNVVTFAQLKRRSFRGVVDVVYGGEKPEPKPDAEPTPKKKEKQTQNNKRTAADANIGGEDTPISKREKKRREKEARFKEKQAENAKATDTDT